MEIKNSRRRIVEEVPWGVYLWQMPNGQFVANDEEHFLMIFSTKGNREKIQQLRDFVNSYGITEGRPVWISGQRPVTDEEYEEQRQRLLFGLNPDPLDIPAIVSDRKMIRRGG